MIDLESKIFERSHIDYNKLVEYGFLKDDTGYRYTTDMLANEFRTEIVISPDGLVSGKVYENQTGEEYHNIRIEEMNGAFVNTVREAYRQVLQDIRKKCYIDDYFSTAQANRMTKYIMKQYDVQPEFLWKRFVGYGVFRNPHNRKWFGIIMHIDRNKITPGEGKVDVLDIRIDARSKESLMTETGIYAAYHMNKKNWISIILDEGLSDERILHLIDESYTIVQGRSKRNK
jgi:predicted DNA-binding protein (MmcQ/YjbR family)